MDTLLRCDRAPRPPVGDVGVVPYGVLMTSPGRPIATAAEICDNGPWTLDRVRESLFFAEAYDRTVGMEPVRAMASLLVHDAEQRGWDVHALRALVALATEGDLNSPDRISHEISRLVAAGGLLLDPLEFATWLGAFEAFVAAIPEGPVVWCRRPHGPTGWITLDTTEDDVRQSLGKHSVSTVFPVLGHAGFAGLTADDIREHELSVRHRVDPDFVLGLQDGISPWNDPRLDDLWAFHRVARAVFAHGSAFTAYQHADGGAVKFRGSFEELYRGRVDSLESFLFNIGMRDGWWMEAEGVFARHGLSDILRIDTSALWGLYEQLGWCLATDLQYDQHLFAPPDHVGPIPSVQQVVAALAEQRADAEDDGVLDVVLEEAPDDDSGEESPFEDDRPF